MNVTLFSVSEGELQEATGDLPAYSEGESKQSITTTPVGRVFELGAEWDDVHKALGNHGEEHPLGFLVAGGKLVPNMKSGSEESRCFGAAETVTLLAWVARLEDGRVRKLRQFLADTVLAGHGVIVHRF